MFPVLWRKIILLFLLCGPMLVNAQIRGNYNYLDFESKPYYFGVSLGYNSAHYRIIHSNQLILNDSLNVAESATTPGFNVGIITNIKLGSNFDFRSLIPTISFSDRKLAYLNTENSAVDKKVESVLLEFPFQFRYKSKPWNDVRVFLVAGAKYSLDLASNSRTRQAEELVKVAPSDFSIEYGAGMQFFMPYFIFSPEIKISHGLNNILVYDNDLVYSSVIERLISRTFTITLHFEG